MENHFIAISESVKNGDHEQTINRVKEALNRGTPALELLQKGLVPGIQALGALFKEGQVFLPEILISVRAMNRGLEVLRPSLADAEVPKRGTVVLGTVEGDLHDIGKNLVRMMLEGNGYAVVDLGVDVKPKVFFTAAREHKADIVALSTLLTTTMPCFQKVIAALEEGGIRGTLKVMVGGAPVSRAFADEIGAEGFAEDCVRAVEEANRLLTGRKEMAR